MVLVPPGHQGVNPLGMVPIEMNGSQTSKYSTNHVCSKGSQKRENEYSNWLPFSSFSPGKCMCNWQWTEDVTNE